MHTPTVINDFCFLAKQNHVMEQKHFKSKCYQKQKNTTFCSILIWLLLGSVFSNKFQEFRMTNHFYLLFYCNYAFHKSTLLYKHIKIFTVVTSPQFSTSQNMQLSYIPLESKLQPNKRIISATS